MSIFTLESSAGMRKDYLMLVLKALVFVYCAVSLVSIELVDAIYEGLPISLTFSPSDLPLPDEFRQFRRKRLAPQQTEPPQHPPSRLVASVTPPTSSRFSKPSMKRNDQSPRAGLVVIAPTQSSNGVVDLT